MVLTILKNLPNLKDLYLWQTKVSTNEINTFLGENE